ncbi:MAG: NAD-dependent epimerase/dehydratase family protein [Polyangiaceae bacterium]|nr:NAD-dependent epimerase/dehydratase family protein [Polyangiaceae bacterium]
MSRFWVAGTGFLGTHVVRCLLDAGHQVTVASIEGGEVHGLPVEPVDILDAAGVERSARGADGAFLCTGKVSRRQEDAELMHRLHVFGTRTALGALEAAGVRRAVVASTSGTIAVGTDPDQIWTEDDEPPLETIAKWPYYRTKLFGEQEALKANAPPVFEVVVVNPTLLLGPGDVRDSSTSDVRRFLERQIPAIPAGGYAFVDARDAAKGMLLAFELGRPGERYLLNAKNLTVAAFFQRLERLTGIRAPFMRLPKSRELALGLNDVFSRAIKAIGGKSPVEEADVDMGQHFWYASSAKAERELGWRARDPSETLRDTVNDLIERKVVLVKSESYREPARTAE